MPRRAAIALAAVAIFAVARPLAADDDLRPQDVRQAIKSARRWISRQQMRDGAWPYIDLRYRVGASSLATLALLQAGAPADDPDILRALRFISSEEENFTYTLALKIAALAAADPQRYRADIESCARRLARLQLDNGSWTYGGGDIRIALGRGDNSNTQFALYGLHEAARVGVKFDRAMWQKAADYWTKTQCPDGGWHYLGQGPTGYGSMTAAGVASLLICGNSVNASLEHGYKAGAADNCGRYATPRALAAGIRWLGDHFDVRRNPGHPAYPFYWLYALERAGMLSGLKQFGEHDWYREGAAALVASQAADGSWNESLLDTSFALLFLAKGRHPILINKLAWSSDQRWNQDRHDCENLTAFLGDRLGERVTWQSVALSAPVETWLEAPILYFNGHEFPRLTGAERNKLRKFVDAGGTIVAEACCSKPAFRNGFEEFARAAFGEFPLVELGEEHPIWSSQFKLRPGAFRLLGLDSGCRTSVIFAPVDLSCLWEQAGSTGSPPQSDEAIKLGANIAAYVTGREPLRDKLDVVTLPPEHGPSRDAAASVGAVQFAQIVYGGDWRPDPDMLPNLAEALHKAAGVDLVTAPAALRLGDAALLEHPIAYMTGHFSFRMSEAERDALRDYLKRGGFLFAEACCGRKAFDSSFRQLVAQLFPAQPLAALPTDHPILTGKPGYDIRRIAYRPGVAGESAGLDSPHLEAVTLDGRAVIVYSPFGLGCGVAGHQCFNCRGVASEDARKVAVNIMLYALSS